MVRRQLSIVSYSAKLRPLPSSAFFEISLSFLLFHDRKSDETSRLVLRGWRADLSDLEKGAREPVQDSCPTYSGRLRDLNGNISLPPNPEWPSENVRRLAVSPIHFLKRFSKSFCTSAASFPSISLPTVIHSELALCSFQPFARGTLGLLSVRGKVSFAN